ncbi:restriction endonuclease subunit S [Methylobacter psychrophilus]|uniref:restriction endonuclease subunit S n=1 Tax=Methylobacter psychrophilus TaxID=96941 RepID=UPI0021D4F45B|nr:restriction endonuclease subunit S [Methylobacter psychrophilus]
MKYQAYPDYKDSGVEWLGDVPEHWTVSKIKFIAPYQVGWTPPTKNDANFDGENLWANISDLRGKIIHDTAKKISDEAAKVASMDITPGGSLLYSFKLSVGCVSFAGKDMYTNEAIASFLEGATLPLSYLYYVLPKFVIENASTNIYGARILNQELISNAMLLAPSTQEAEKIANFLDHETAKIDTLIKKQQQLIKLLKEKRQAVISHAVTKGLNPNVLMRDSGVEWLGEVPEHWSKSYLGFECSVKARLGWKGLKAEEYVENGFIFLATPNIKELEIDFENVNYITKKRYEESPEIMLEIGDVLVTKDGSTTGTTNVVKCLPSPSTVNSSIAVLRTIGRINSLYLYFFFVSTYTQNVIKCMQGGMGVPHLFQADLRKFNVLLPPTDEQLEIVTYIERRLPKFDELLEKITQQITLLRERRTALISAAVTGKIDVRSWQAPEPLRSNNEINKEEAA